MFLFQINTKGSYSFSLLFSPTLAEFPTPLISSKKEHWNIRFKSITYKVVSRTLQNIIRLPTFYHFWVILSKSKYLL